MTPFYTRFPDVAAAETRCIHVVQPGGPLPLGEYGFVEFYCEDDGCDCRRVLLQVMMPQAPRTALATINYGWESVEFYTRWMHGDEQAGREISDATLDPLHPQSKYADHLLDFFREIMMADLAYVARLARHYEMFKGAPGKQSHEPAAVDERIRQNQPGAPGPVSQTGGDSAIEQELHQLDDLMQEGYELLEARRASAACDAWLRAWELFGALYEKGGFTSLHAFDLRFHGTQFVSNWVQDLELGLLNAGLENPVYYEHRVRYCEDFLNRFGAVEELMRENMRRAIAESWASLGQQGRSDALFEQWLKDDPQWGWGWIGWADTYFFCQAPHRDLPRAEALLKRGLDVAGVRERRYIVERLADLYEEQKRTAEAGALRQSLRTATAAPAKAKVGRNDPCPCGSGRKYKKCCGKN